MIAKLEKISLLTILLLVLFSTSTWASTTYQYNDLHRLTRVERADGSVTVYQYDDFGNRTSLKSTLPGPLVILSPNGGETLTMGQSCTITWGANILSNIRLSLYKGDVEVLNIAENLDPSDLSYTFTLPENLEEGSDYRILISAENGTVSDFSDGFFTIAPPSDTDSDGLFDTLENAGCTSYDNPDTDADGLLDGIEDANHNGVVDAGETNPCSLDTDGDGMPDGWEIEYGLNPIINDADGDADGDGIHNFEEYQNGTNPSIASLLLFSDDFDDNSIDSSKWTYSRNQVVEENEIMKVEVTVTDNGGILQSKWISFNPDNKIIIQRKANIHYANQYYGGRFRINIEGVPEYSFGLEYDNYSYSSSIGSNYPNYGFFITRNNASSTKTTEIGDISEMIEPCWNEWFDEKIEYDPVTGGLRYYINNELKREYNVGVLPSLDSYRMQLYIYNPSSRCWYTGHYQYSDDIMVNQVIVGKLADIVKLPDTGQIQCYDNDMSIDCPQPGEPFYGQDAQYQGPRSYTKLDASGNDLPDTAGEWFMVRDNVTGLIWEVKQANDGVPNYANPHDADNTYTWYDSNPETNGGNHGTPGDGTDTEDFIAALNAENYGGRNNWRLPTVTELNLLVDRGHSNPSIDTDFFSDILNIEYPDYHTSTPFAWVVGFAEGYLDLCTLDCAAYVRAVSGAEPRSTDGFVDNGDGTVSDNKTGLMWQQSLVNDDMTWQEAMSYCETLSLAGYSDWRLPNINELQSIAHYDPSFEIDGQSFAIDYHYFPDIIDSFAFSFWSSTTKAGDAEAAWLLDTTLGYVTDYVKRYHSSVIAVRSFSPHFSGADFNADNHPDLLWRNYTTGHNYLWYFDELTYLGGASVSAIGDTDWQIVGIADFNQDSHPDILWRNTSTGDNYVWYMDDNSKIGGHFINKMSDTDWHIVGVSDFNGDTHPDLLWRNMITGANYLWYLDDCTRIGTHYVASLSDTDWNIVGTADFNSDSHPDILWRNYSTGENYIYYMNDWQKTGSHYVSRVTDVNWAVGQLSDFNSDGQVDILWRNQSTGDNYVWYLNDWQKTGGSTFKKLSDLNWHMAEER